MIIFYVILFLNESVVSGDKPLKFIFARQNLSFAAHSFWCTVIFPMPYCIIYTLVKEMPNRSSIILQTNHQNYYAKKVNDIIIHDIARAIAVIVILFPTLLTAINLHFFSRPY